jgi:hypothetical protein
MGTWAGSRCRPCSCALADQLNYPGRHQVPEHVVPVRGGSEPQHPACALQGIQQVPHPGGRDRQRSAARRLQAQAGLQLPGRDPPLRRSLQLCLTVRRLQVLDLPRPTPRDPHDSHRRRTRRGPHCPHVRHQTTSPAAPSAQVQPIRTANPKVSAARLPRTRYREPTQVRSLAGGKHAGSFGKRTSGVADGQRCYGDRLQRGLRARSRPALRPARPRSRVCA